MKKNGVRSYIIENKKRFVSIWLLRLFILFFILYEFEIQRIDIFCLNIIVLFLTFAPGIIKKITDVILPFPFELLYLLALFSTVAFEKILTGALVQIILGIFFGVVGFFLMYILYFNSRIKYGYKLITIFSFSFSVSVGALWEVLRFVLYQFDISFGLDQYPLGLILTILGASLVSIIVYMYLKYGEGKIVPMLIKSFINRNPTLFKDTMKSPDTIKNLILSGENEQVEFKSTLRTNLHTKTYDKQMEYEILKTITAFLNTDGGTLLIGVSDNGKILGIEKEGYKTIDKFFQHYSNLIQNHIGNEYRPLINSTIIPIDDKNILKIDCFPSDKEVFITIENEQYFYVRIGPASVKLTGKSLLDYVKKNF